jgi:hypothetical protein
MTTASGREHDMTTIFLAGQPVELSAEAQKLLQLLSKDKVFPRECADIKNKLQFYWELIVREREDKDNLALKTSIEAAGLSLAAAIEHRNQLREMMWRKVAKRRGIIGICGHCGLPITREDLHHEKPPVIVQINTDFYGFLGEAKTADFHDIKMVLLVCEHCQEDVLDKASTRRTNCAIQLNHPWPALPMSERWSRVEKVPPAIWFADHQRKGRVICLPGISTTLVYLR